MAASQSFRAVMRKLEEEHCREISRLRREHQEEIGQLRTEHTTEVSTLQKQLSSNTSNGEQSPERAIYSSSPDGAGQGIHLSSPPPEQDGIELAISPGVSRLSARLKSGTKKMVVTKMEQENMTLHKHVSTQLISQTKVSRVASLLDKYAMARGWKVHHSVEARQDPNAKALFVKLQALVNHQGFDAICAIAIILNTALLGAVTTFRAATLNPAALPLQYVIANKCFSCWFLIELILRWTAEGPVTFLVSSPNVFWNLFDVFVVSTDVIEHVIDWVTEGDSKALGNLTIMRMLRVLRIARALRIVRLVSFCKELRMMVLSILRSGMSLIWSMVLLSIIIYIFGIFLMQSVTSTLSERMMDKKKLGEVPSFEEDTLEWKLDRYFGNLAMTFYMLFQTVSGGVSWGELADPLSEAHWTNGLVFCFYVFFTIFAMLNIITGIFVETAINSVQNDSDEVIQEEMKSENSLIKQLHTLFKGVDQEKTGRITEEQFESLVENKRTYALLGAMGLQVSEARGVFALLDLDHSGFVSIDDFLVGCMRLRGGAKSVDLVSLMYENRKLMDKWEKMARFLEVEFARMDKFEDRVDYCLARMELLPDLTEGSWVLSPKPPERLVSPNSVHDTSLSPGEAQQREPESGERPKCRLGL